MELFDAMICRIEDSFSVLQCETLPYDPKGVLKERDSFAMVFQNDTALELGSVGKHAVNLTCVTSDRELIPEDCVRIVGSDIGGMGEKTDYARICQVLVKYEEGSEHKLLQDMDFIKFHIYPEDVMIRTSGQSSAERIRIGKKAVDRGFTLERLGHTYISHYKKDPRVLSVRVTFVNVPEYDYAALEDEAKLCVSVRNSLSLIQKGLPKDCDKCTISDICGEIEGLKKLHFG